MRPSETNLKLVSIIVLLISHRLQFVSLVELEDELRLTREENGKLDMACRNIIYYQVYKININYSL